MNDDPAANNAMDCNELVELITAYLDQDLDRATLTRFEAHLRECVGCRNYLEQFRVTLRSLGRVRDEQLDPAFRDRLLSAFHDWS